MNETPRIVVVGLGYVGLPLAVALAVRSEVVGFDVDSGRIAELKQGHDRTSHGQQGHGTLRRDGGVVVRFHSGLGWFR